MIDRQNPLIGCCLRPVHEVTTPVNGKPRKAFFAVSNSETNAVTTMLKLFKTWRRQHLLLYMWCEMQSWWRQHVQQTQNTVHLKAKECTVYQRPPQQLQLTLARLQPACKQCNLTPNGQQNFKWGIDNFIDIFRWLISLLDKLLLEITGHSSVITVLVALAFL